MKAVETVDIGPSREAVACFHCELPVPAATAWYVSVDGEDRPMCCPGCQAVARLIFSNGLGDYYRFREAPPANPVDIEADIVELARYDRPALRAEIVRSLEDGRNAVSLAVEGLRCSACCWLIESKLTRLRGVAAVRVSLQSERCDVEWSGNELTPRRLVEAILELGYHAYPFRPDERARVRAAERRRSLIRLGIAGFATLQVMMFAAPLYLGAAQGMADSYRVFLRWVSALVTLPVIVVSARPFFESARRDLGNRRLGMDVPVSIAVVTAFATSIGATLLDAPEVYFDSVCMFVFFLLIGRHFEARARDHAAQTIENALRSPPMTAAKLGDGSAVEIVSVGELAPGDRVLVKPGETFPADGIVVEGRGSVDEAMLSGEHWPREKSAGDPVLGGSQNGESSFVVETTRAGHESTLAGIVRMVEAAGADRPPIARTADGIAAVFVPAVLLGAIATICWWWPTDPTRGFHAALAVLVATCPCALSLATPAALAAATGGLLARGFLVASGHVFEGLAAATHVVFDKTGTLTRGRLRLRRVSPVGGRSESDCLRIAAALESRSEHPIARAFAPPESEPAELPVLADARNIVGKGMEGTVDGRRTRIGIAEWVDELATADKAMSEPSGDGWILLGDQSGRLCWFQLDDTPRPDAGPIVRALHERGLETAVLSGDRAATVRALAGDFGISTAIGGMTPAGKLEYVETLQRGGAVVVMVGDGVNDAPGLGRADVSVAMGGGTDLAVSRSDSVLLVDDLSVLVRAYDHARKTRHVIAQNLAWAALYNVIVIPFAALGWIAPYWAAAGMSASSLLVVGNAMRLGIAGPRSARTRQAAPFRSGATPVEAAA